MNSLNENYLENIKFGQTELATLRMLGEYQGKQILYSKQSPEVLQGLQKVAVIESSESSNRLEGIEVSPDRIEKLILGDTTPEDRSEQEVAGYRDALALIHELFEDIPFSSNVLLQLHTYIYKYMPTPGGRWKSTDNEIIETLPSGKVRVRFKAVAAFETPKYMQELEENYRSIIDKNMIDPLVVIPLAVLDFLCIHPFSDGNGRVARLLTLLLLYHFDYQVGRYISLERIFEQSKEDYYRTLEESSQGWHENKHDPLPWLNYFWVALLKAYKEFEERVGTINPGKGSKSNQVRQFVMKQLGAFSISDIEKEFPWISRDMIRIVLREMRDENTIQTKGKGRGAKWVLINK
ncbi:MAG: cell filamentation protein Fic [Halobacteriovoraceae bacterium]|nr:cell filamentation protein Fic [Halobacteriovoraceae bacterium]|tara:strand:- start:74048 stop:75097 length:1050 start_codon:yes stop_codon:yes gene_type:complete